MQNQLPKNLTKMLDYFNRSLANRNYNRRQGRFKYENGKFRRVARKPYALKEAPVLLGPGSTIARVTINYEYQPGETNVGVVNLIQNMVNNTEFERNLPLYKFWKLEGVKIIIPPRLDTFNGTVPTARIGVDWNNDLIENIRQDDSSKEFSGYQTRMKVFRYIAPNALLSASNGKTVNYGDWVATNYDLQNTIPPGFIKIYSTFNFFFTVECIVLFKGSQVNFSVNREPLKVPTNMIIKKEEEPKDDIINKIRKELEKIDK
jgi:hypothetical protein